MSPFRIALRWVLTFVAVGLVILALLVSGLRLAAHQVDTWRDGIATQLARQFNATARIETLDGDMHGLDPALAVGGLQLSGHVGADAFPLLEVERASLRLDTGRSLRARFPVFSDVRVSHATLHLYQAQDGSWHWPQPADVPPELVPETAFDLQRLDFWIGILLRQRAEVDDLRLVLHGVEDTVTLTAPRLLMAGSSERTHIEGRLFVETLEGNSAPAMEAVLEVLPGPDGGDDFSATLQASADLSPLSRLGRVLSAPLPVRLIGIAGETEVWGRWRAGRLEDVRTRLAIPELSLASGDDAPVVLRDVGGRVQWLRGAGQSWQAWVNALSLRGESIPGSSLPQRLHVAGDARHWTLSSSPIDLAAVATLGQQLPLPDAVHRALAGLAPRGQVTGLNIGREDGQWRARAALRGAAVSPWQGAPGGGPVDAWVEARGREGEVRFVGDDGVQLAFPDIFAAPMVLDSASGTVEWTLDEGAFSVTGEQLRASWRGAQVDGGFRYAGRRNGGGDLTLDLAMRDVDAVNTPLMDWLPVKVLDEELRDWLAGGIAGRVPEGSLHLEQHLDAMSAGDAAKAEEDAFDGELRLDLQVEEGRLTYDPQWPALEKVRGRLTVVNETLQATVDHAETLGMTSDGATVALKDDRLEVDGPVRAPTQSLLRFLAAAPIEGMDDFAEWRGEGQVTGHLSLNVPMETPEALEVDIQGDVDVPSLTLPQVDLVLGGINGALHYRHVADTDFLTGELGARAFDGPLLARFDVGGEGITLEGRALGRGLAAWAEMTQLTPLLSGYFPYAANLDLAGEEPRLVVDSTLQGLAIQLPPPFGKRLDESVPLHLESTPGQRLQLELAERLKLRWRALGADRGQGQVWLERWPASAEWPRGDGWELTWRTPRLYLGRWQTTLASLEGEASSKEAASTAGSSTPLVSQPGAALPNLRRLRLVTDCLHVEQRCLGSLEANASPLADGWRLDLAGNLLQGRAEYLPARDAPLEVDLSQLNLDTLLPALPETPELAQEVATTPEPTPLPGWLAKVPDGEISIGTIIRQGSRLGPLSANWQASSQRLSIAPLSLALGDVTATGELVWEASGAQASLTRSRLALEGGDLGTALQALGQPVAIRSSTTQVTSQLAWPGAPTQFALERSRGSVETLLERGRFVTLDSPSARLVGLLNVDNLLRRLRLDFSDVTGEGTAFDSVRGDATLYGGRLETRGPVEIDGPSTQFTLDGSADLAARELDMLLGITVPVSRNLPLAAVLVGAPYVGGALFIADKVFGGWLDKVTRIHYRVRGPWTSPQITLEDAE